MKSARHVGGFQARSRVGSRHARVARLRSPDGETLGVPLLDAQLVKLTNERLVLSGIERHEDELRSKIEDFAQTWVCWLTP